MFPSVGSRWCTQVKLLRRKSTDVRGSLADGKYLASVGADTEHTVAVHEWETKPSPALAGPDNTSPASS